MRWDRHRGCCACAAVWLWALVAPAAAAPPERSTVVKVMRPVVVRDAPAGEPVRRLGAAALARDTYRLLVVRERAGWVEARLPMRPNGATGWLPADALRRSTTRWAVRVDLRRRTVSAYRDGRLRRRFRAVIGAPGTPTPTGRFAIFKTVRQADPDGFLGSWALHLTAHSDVLFDYGGGPGRVAIHGRGGASLSDPLGAARSHGCVRVDNAAVEWLRRRARPGTPVAISAGRGRSSRGS